VKRCYFSFVVEYEKVKRNFTELAKQEGVKIIDCGDDFEIELANELAEIAGRYGIEMFSCCGDYLIGGKIKKAHCVDGSIIEQLCSPSGFLYCDKPTRKECGCTESVDIGAYDTCSHGCVYCYANANKRRAFEAVAGHDIDSAFLGVSKSESNGWLAELNASLLMPFL
jgi:hypothetical protein